MLRIETMDRDVSANRSRSVIGSPYPHQPLHRLDQFFRIVADAIFENDLDLFDVADVRRGISFNNHQVSLFARSDRTDAGVLSQKLCAVEAGNLDRFDRSKTRFDQELDLTH